MEKGRGWVGTFKMRTLENKFVGMPRGVEAMITFVVTGRSYIWENKLPASLKPKLIPEYEALEAKVKELGGGKEVRKKVWTDFSLRDPLNFVENEEFDHFPYFSVLTQLQPTKQQANMNAHLATFHVLANWPHFQLDKVGLNMLPYEDLTAPRFCTQLTKCATHDVDEDMNDLTRDWWWMEVKKLARHRHKNINHVSLRRTEAKYWPVVKYTNVVVQNYKLYSITDTASTIQTWIPNEYIEHQAEIVARKKGKVDPNLGVTPLEMDGIRLYIN